MYKFFVVFFLVFLVSACSENSNVPVKSISSHEKKLMDSYSSVGMDESSRLCMARQLKEQIDELVLEVPESIRKDFTGVLVNATYAFNTGMYGNYLSLLGEGDGKKLVEAAMESIKLVAAGGLVRCLSG